MLKKSRTGVTGDARKGSATIERSQLIFNKQDPIEFPWVERFSDGTMWLGCSIDQHMVSERGFNLWSLDNGKTWDKPNIPVAVMETRQMSNGGVVNVSAWFAKETGENQYPLTVNYYKTPRSKPESLTAYATIPSEFADGGGGLALHRSLTRLPNGDLLASAYGRLKGEPGDFVYCIVSHDGAKSWSLQSVVASPKHYGMLGSEGFNEPYIIRLANNDLLCFMRTGGPLLQSRSTDGGKTWDKPRVIADYGVDPCAILMSNDALVVSYGRPGAAIQIDYDGTGENWDQAPEVYGGTRCGYTSMVEVEPGLLMLFYTESSFCAYGVGVYPTNRMMVACIRVEPTKIVRLTWD